MQTLTYSIGSDKRAVVKDLQNFTVDFSGSDYNWVQARQYERDMRQVFVNVQNADGSPFDLTGCNIVFEGILPNKVNRVIDSKHGVILDPTNGQFRFDMPGQAFAVAGSYQQAFFRIMRAGSSITTLEFDLEVLADKVISDLLPADYITPFEDLYGDLEDVITKANSDIKTALDNGNKSIADLITKSGIDVATAVDAITAKGDSVFDTLTKQGADVTTLLTTLEAQIKTDGIAKLTDLNNYVKINSDGTLNIQGTTTNFASAEQLQPQLLSKPTDAQVAANSGNTDTFVAVKGQEYYVSALVSMTTEGDVFKITFKDSAGSSTDVVADTTLNASAIGQGKWKATADGTVTVSTSEKGTDVKYQHLTVTQTGNYVPYERAMANKYVPQTAVNLPTDLVHTADLTALQATLKKYTDDAEQAAIDHIQPMITAEFTKRNAPSSWWTGDATAYAAITPKVADAYYDVVES
ncbi:phage baseplate upper protein [Lactobacillus sp. LC28-10]|uniref:Phage baseplate upper protein n=1 Tax=Secundilactobacillus angelensis TaxID=2722706 RepID=A0ABX1KXY9_9LACO|nr:phage baseplate upper protein [Secundilactobacillus angelensis]MCH5461494.1 phage baseplate upper protein [Secundilactobacillus angelensis]NLR17693.1 phage baseplate upper protein [Secundilactobacillus angelensis]